MLEIAKDKGGTVDERMRFGDARVEASVYFANVRTFGSSLRTNPRYESFASHSEFGRNLEIRISSIRSIDRSIEKTKKTSEKR